MNKHLELLGWEVKDKVTNFEGVVTHIGFDLYGCLQAIVQPPAFKEGNGNQKDADSKWFDLSRLEKIGDSPVMNPIPLKGLTVTAGNDCNKPLK